MPIDIKGLIADGLLELVEEKHLEKITIKDILSKTGVSRQTFYNHFKDKNDLIQYIYFNKVIKKFNGGYEEMDFHKSLLESFYKMKEYHKFLKQACLMTDQNCLKDYIFEHCKEFDLKYHQYLYGRSPIPDNLKFATEYHAIASTSMTLSWILSDMVTPCEEMAGFITQLRNIGMDELFKDGDNSNPYKLTNE